MAHFPNGRPRNIFIFLYNTKYFSSCMFFVIFFAKRMFMSQGLKLVCLDWSIKLAVISSNIFVSRGDNTEKLH